MPLMSLAEIKAAHDGEIPSYAWPGGYPLYYVTADCGVLSPEAVRENEEQCMGRTEDWNGKDRLPSNEAQWRVVGVEVNYEDASLYCDHTGKRIPSAYAEDEVVAE